MKRQAEIMKNKPEKRGMTLVEILMAVVILLILITLTVTIGRSVEQQGQEKLTIETINLVLHCYDTCNIFNFIKYRR